MSKRILHISDLHINDPNSTTENLRSSRYKEFIDDLYVSYKTSYGEQDLDIDLLFITGDFIDKGKVANFGHAEAVVDYIVEKFKVTAGSTFVCIGNHDLIRSEDAAGNLGKAVEDYANFARKYNNDKIHSETVIDNRATIYKVSDEYILIIDAVSDTKGTDRPATDISDAFIDLISGEWVRDKIPEDANLYILSHYPLVQSKKDLLDYEEADWTGRHIWKAGYPIKERISKSRGSSSGKTIWFFGDAHLPDFICESESPSVVYLMTGQFGGNYANPVSTNSGNAYKPYHQVTTLTVETTSVRRVVFSYNPKGFQYSAHMGEWTGTKSSLHFETVLPAVNKLKEEKAAFVVPVGNSIEDEIYEEVKNEELYKFGKFVTSEKKIALGWVSINSLFRNTFLLSNGIDKIIEWLKKTITLDKEHELFIGCGFWGGILASNVSVRTQINAYSVSSFISSPSKCPDEESIGYIVGKIKGIEKIKRIVIFTDVI
ncbi:MAG: hypothetical protein JWQ25_469, partial [Daejeonella sp.]|nr:hypothetical protein [Daejeonella sp.]